MIIFPRCDNLLKGGVLREEEKEEREEKGKEEGKEEREEKGKEGREGGK